MAVLAALALTSLSAPPEARAADDTEILSLHTSFDHYWRRYLEAATSGDNETADRMLDEIRRLRVERNVFALNDVAISFVYQGFGLLEADRVELARENFEIARDLSPRLPTAYWGLAQADERSGGLGYLTGMLHRIQAQLAALRSERDGAYAGWNLLFLLFTALMIVYFAYAAALIYRYGVLLSHDVEERIGDRVGENGAVALTVGILVLPILLTVGAGWLAPYWLSLTFGYQAVKERAVTVVGLLVLLAVAPFVEVYAAWTRTTANPVYQAALSSVTGTFDVDDVRVLREAAHRYPDDRDLQFLIAIQFKNLGDYELAANQYRRILNNFPGDLEAQMNLGNVYFAQRDWEGALVQYNEVLAADSQLAMAHYNKSLAHAENFQFAEREEARARAETIDASAVAAHERRTGDYRVVADARLEESEILAKFYGLPEGMHEPPVKSLLTGSSVGGHGLRFVIGALAFATLILLLELTIRERKLTRRCWKCGSAFCGRCQIGTGRQGLCTQCYHLYRMKDGVSAQARNEKLAQVQRASTVRSVVFRALSVLAPGSGHIGEGMPVLGSALLAIWVFCVCALWFGGTLYSIPSGLFGTPTGPSYALFGLMALVLLLANFVSRPLTRA